MTTYLEIMVIVNPLPVLEVALVSAVLGPHVDLVVVHVARLHADRARLLQPAAFRVGPTNKRNWCLIGRRYNEGIFTATDSTSRSRSLR